MPGVKDTHIILEERVSYRTFSKNNFHPFFLK